MTNPILLNIYRDIACQKLTFQTFFRIFDIKPEFCDQIFLFFL